MRAEGDTSRARLWHERPAATVVVLTRDRVDEVLRTLAHLRTLPGRPPIIVVDNASSDGTPTRVRAAFDDIEVVPLDRNHGAAARTVGVARATTQLVAFSDDDSWWAPDAIGRAAGYFAADPRIGLVAARVLVGPDERLDPVSAGMRRAPLGHRGLPGPMILGFLACGAVVRRDAYLAAGGFSPLLWLGGEEELLALDLAAAGWELVYADDVVAHHHPSRIRDSRQRRRLLARNAVWCVWLRRRPVPAVLCTAEVTRRALRDPAAARGLVDAVRGLPAVLRNRRRLPVHVERAATLLRRDRLRNARHPAGIAET